MSAAIATLEDFERFEKKMLKLISSLSDTGAKKEYLTKDDCFELFGIKDRTLTELRQQRVVTYAKVGNSCIYKYTSILEYLEKREIEAISS